MGYHSKSGKRDSLTKSGTLTNAGFFDASDRYPAGGILSTPIDLTRFSQSLLNDKIVNKKTKEMMWTSAQLNSREKTGHGLGWKISDDDKVVFHGGKSVGFTTFLYVCPSEELVVAIAVNLSMWSRDRYKLANELAELYTVRN